MPRQVDREERRREIIEALWRVTARDGLGAVSFRVVAAEAGVSVRRVQYYFGSKAGLLAGALEELGRRTVTRSQRAIEQLGADPEPRQVLRAAIAASLPTDAESRLHAQLFMSFYVAAITDEALSSAEALTTPQWIVPFAADVIRRDAPGAGVDAEIDADTEALLLITAFSGLTLSLLAGIISPEDALAAVDYRIDRLFRERRPARPARRRRR